MVDELNYLEGYFSNSTVLWLDTTPYSPIKRVPLDTPADITVALNTVNYNSNSYSSYSIKGLNPAAKTPSGNTVGCVLDLCFFLTYNPTPSNSVICLKTGQGTQCMTAAKTSNNNTIGPYDFVIWYAGTAYDTIAYLPN